MACACCVKLGCPAAGSQRQELVVNGQGQRGGGAGSAIFCAPEAGIDLTAANLGTCWAEGSLPFSDVQQGIAKAGWKLSAGSLSTHGSNSRMGRSMVNWILPLEYGCRAREAEAGVGNGWPQFAAEGELARRMCLAGSRSACGNLCGDLADWPCAADFSSGRVDGQVQAKAVWPRGQLCKGQ